MSAAEKPGAARIPTYRYVHEEHRSYVDNETQKALEESFDWLASADEHVHDLSELLERLASAAGVKPGNVGVFDYGREYVRELFHAIREARAYLCVAADIIDDDGARAEIDAERAEVPAPTQ